MEIKEFIQERGIVSLYHFTLIDNLVPNVYGMGARDALYLLEKSGLNVNVTGSGRVVSQSIGPGQKIVRGRTVNLVMQ